jgi:hypothetical protein
MAVYVWIVYAAVGLGTALGLYHAGTTCSTRAKTVAWWLLLLVFWPAFIGRAKARS